MGIALAPLPSPAAPPETPATPGGWRTTVERLQVRRLVAEEGDGLAPVVLPANPRPLRSTLRRHDTRIGPEVAAGRSSLARGPVAAAWRAPILGYDGPNAVEPLPAPEPGPAPSFRHAIVRTASSWAGSPPAGPEEAAARLAQGGLAVDWLAHFVPPGGPDTRGDRVARWLGWIAAEAAAGRTGSTAFRDAVGSAAFDFQPTGPGFRAFAEDGTEDAPAFRIQAGGGVRGGGLIPGGSLHVIHQLIGAFPGATFVVSVPADFADAVQAAGFRSWPLTRPRQLHLVSEPLPFTGWAQDNGKSGRIPTSAGGSATGLLVPRFATSDEAGCVRVPGDSWAVEGLRAAGLEVRQSPLLFQGGNLLVLRPPDGRGDVLMVSQVEIDRNRGLGLTEPEVLEAFRREFGAERVHAIPAWSFHLDLDVSLRTSRDGAVAFGLDPAAGARGVWEAVRERLGRIGATGIPAPDADTPAGWRTWMHAHTRPGEPLPAGLIPLFQTAPDEDPGLNANCLLSALDVLVALDGGAPEDPVVEPLRQLLRGRDAQREALVRLGFRWVPVPALPDLVRTVGSVNALQFRDRIAVPVWGGLFESLDRAALEIFRREAGPGVGVVPIRCAGSLRLHGGVRCIAQPLPPVPAR